MFAGKSKLFLGSVGIIISFMIASIAFTTPTSSYDMPKVEKEWTCTNGGFSSDHCYSESCAYNVFHIWSKTGDQVFNFDAPRAGEYECTIEVVANHFDYKSDAPPQINERVDVFLNNEQVGTTEDKWCPPDNDINPPPNVECESGDNCVYVDAGTDVNGFFTAGNVKSFSGSSVCFKVDNVDALYQAMLDRNGGTEDAKDKQFVFGLGGVDNYHHFAAFYRYMKPGGMYNKMHLMEMDTGFNYDGNDRYGWCYLTKDGGPGGRGLELKQGCVYKIDISLFGVTVSGGKDDITFTDGCNRYLVYPSGLDLNLYCDKDCKGRNTNRVHTTASGAGISKVDCATFRLNCNGENSGSDPCDINGRTCADFDCGTGPLTCVGEDISIAGCSDFPGCLYTTMCPDPEMIICGNNCCTEAQYCNNGKCMPIT
ncbi:MAG: hypothetical protein KAS04_02055 [Candidatus Aenigmarchaeota archaeon]|nr:hypothetical protein [Candidatus Aenigmarchaeota archaeon]